MPAISRLVARTLVNFAIVIVAIAFVLSLIFAIQAQKYLEGLAIDIYNVQARTLTEQLARAGYNQTYINMKLQELNQTIYRNLGLSMPWEQRVLLYTTWLLLFNFNAFQARQIYPTGTGSAAMVVYGALKNTVILFTTATVVELLIAILVGLATGKRAGGILDKAIVGFALLTSSVPMWWMGLVFLFAFSYKLGIFPMASKDVFIALANLEAQRASLGPMYYLDVLATWVRYMTLPLITIVFVTFGASTYTVRSIVIGTLREDFVVVARAKGLPERSVLYKHVLRAASPPIVTMVALSMIGSLGGAIISETVFQWPGMGYTFWIAISSGDTGVLVVNTWITVLLFIVVVFVLDFVYMLLDPRIRAGG